MNSDVEFGDLGCLCIIHSHPVIGLGILFSWWCHPHHIVCRLHTENHGYGINCIQDVFLVWCWWRHWRNPLLNNNSFDQYVWWWCVLIQVLRFLVLKRFGFLAPSSSWQMLMDLNLGRWRSSTVYILICCYFQKKLQVIYQVYCDGALTWLRSSSTVCHLAFFRFILGDYQKILDSFFLLGFSVVLFIIFTSWNHDSWPWIMADIKLMRSTNHLYSLQNNAWYFDCSLQLRLYLGIGLSNIPVLRSTSCAV